MSDDPSDNLDHKVALFRYGLIADLIHAEIPQRGEHTGLWKKLREKADQDYDIPGSSRRRVRPETIRFWLRLYRRQGFDGLLPKTRADRGTTRNIPLWVADRLQTIKEEHPDYSVPMVIQEARRPTDSVEPVDESVALPPSTVHRLLSRAGLMQKPKGEPTSLDRRKFVYEQAGELWMSDVMHGPLVVVDTGRRKRKAYLIAFIDDATRIVPFATFALSENTSAFLPVLEQAMLRRGIPKRLYVDNGAAFRSHHLALVCARLGVTLIHAKPYKPQGKGKQERWFRTVRSRFLPTLKEADLASLETLNRRFWTWVEGEYHQTPHHGLDGQTPFERWAMHSQDVRMPSSNESLRELFLFEQKRRVHNDRTVSLDGTLYEVDASLVGQTVLLKYQPDCQKQGIEVWHQGRRIERAKPVDAYANCFVKRNSDTGLLVASDREPKPPVSFTSLRVRDLNPRGES